MVIFRVHQMFL